MQGLLDPFVVGLLGRRREPRTFLRVEYVLFAAFLLYLLPWLIAEGLEHPRRGWVLALVLPLGWTGVGWLGALAWMIRDWPRAPRRPQLAVVHPGQNPGAVARWRRAAAVVAGVLLLAAGAGWWLDGPASRAPARGEAELARSRVELRMGPSARWPSLGDVQAPCRFAVVERKGAWRRVWRTGECAGSMHARSGWVRMELLRPLSLAASS